MWRAGFDEEGELFCDQYLRDWPRRLDAEPWSGPEWMLLSYGKADTDLPHELIVSEPGWELRYVKITVCGVPFHGPACMSGLRIFGSSAGNAPAAPVYSLRRLSELDCVASWEPEEGVNHVVSWGHSPDKLYHSYTIFGKGEQKIGVLIRGQRTFSAWTRSTNAGLPRGR